MVEDPSLRDRLRESVDDLDRRRLQRRFAGVGLRPIAEVPERTPARFGGEVRAQIHASHDGRPALRVRVSDGTGDAVAVFTGRRRLRGMHAGRAVVFEGVGRRVDGRLVVVNPAYTLLG